MVEGLGSFVWLGWVVVPVCISGATVLVSLCLLMFRRYKWIAFAVTEDFNSYKAQLIQAIGVGGCACQNLCNMMTVLPPTPPWEEPLTHEYYDKSPKQTVFLVDPTDNISKECLIRCFCKCLVPEGQTVTCVMFDSLIGWPSPTGGNTWGPAPD